MKKIGLIMDTAFGLTMSEANERGHALIPVQIIINDVVKKPGLDLTTDELLNEMNTYKKEIKLMTSLPQGSDIEAAFDWILERYEKAIYISVSHTMSGTHNAARMIAENNDKYKGKIYCYKSLYWSPWSHAYLEEIEKIIVKYEDFDKISEILDLAVPYMIGQVCPEDIYWFYKGGRLSKMQYMLGSLLKVKPVLTIAHGEMNSKLIERTRGNSKAMDKIIDMVEEQVNVLKEQGLNYKITTIESSIPELSEQMIEKTMERFGITRDEINIEKVSVEQTAHMGPGAFGLTAFVSLKDLMKKKGIE